MGGNTSVAGLSGPATDVNSVVVNVELDFLLSRIRSIQRESIVIVKKTRFKPEILTNLHVLDLPKNTILELCVSVCEHDNSKTIRATGMKF
ncbi:hypothetical protein AVEN_214007-1, partial [Araneus ventricosus]